MNIDSTKLTLMSRNHSNLLKLYEIIITFHLNIKDSTLQPVLEKVGYKKIEEFSSIKDGQGWPSASAADQYDGRRRFEDNNQVKLF